MCPDRLERIAVVRRLDPGSACRRGLDRWRAAWCSVVLAAGIAAATWLIAARLLGHDRPTFAAITAAVMCPTLWARRHGVGALSGELAELAEGIERKADPAHLGASAERLSRLVWSVDAGADGR